MNFIRKIKKLIIGTVVKTYFPTYFIENQSVDISSDIYFIDGVIGINSSSKVLTGKSDATRYAFIIERYEDLIKELSLVDNDVLVGRSSNYLLFRDGKLSVVSSEIDVTADKITFNGVELYSDSGKIKIKVGDTLKEVVVVGGTVNTTTGEIITSGQ